MVAGVFELIGLSKSKVLRAGLNYLLAIILLPIFGALIVASRLIKKRTVVGLGPEPLINNIYHRLALEKFGWTASTYVTHTYFITNHFEFRFVHSSIPLSIRSYCAFIHAVLSYKVLYIYFNGGPLAWTPYRPLEGLIYKMAGIKVVVMPYGGDIHDLSRSTNLLFKHANTVEYPRFQKLSKGKIAKQIDYWTNWADFVISGCDWVDYMWHWDLLVQAHFCVQEPKRHISPASRTKRLKVLHAPNHRFVKGTQFLVNAISNLQAKGHAIELILAEKVANTEVLRLIAEADIVVDQLVIGWYGMFAVEAMAHSKPVVCFLRDDLLELYEFAGVSTRSENPIVSSSFFKIENDLEELITNHSLRESRGKAGYQHYKKFHSVEAIGAVFDSVNRKVLLHLDHAPVENG